MHQIVSIAFRPSDGPRPPAQTRPGREVISREDARARGLKYYFTGRACPKGHVAERRVSDGNCVECVREWGRAYYEANREQVQARKRACYEANREKVLARRRAYYEANREKVLAWARAYREANAEKELARDRAHYEANREKVQARNRAYREANREKVRARDRAYREANREKVRAWVRAYTKTPEGRAAKLIVSARNRAKSKGLDFDLDAQWVAERIEKGCAILGEPFNLTDSPPDGHAAHPRAPSLDRIDSSKGYTKDNVWLVCDAINRAKGSMSIDVFWSMCVQVAGRVPASSEARWAVNGKQPWRE